MDDKDSSAATDVCLVLMFKAPERSKRRLAADGVPAAGDVARLLLECALEDLAGWPGPVCYAPADEAAEIWLADRLPQAGLTVGQGSGNLGQRIESVNAALAARGLGAQIFIGIDCPALTNAGLAAAARALRTADAVIAPAEDGGVVLMGIAGRWPPLAALPWSEATLCDALCRACDAAGLDRAMLATLGDVDSAGDLERVRTELARDPRPARRALLDLVGRSGPRADRAAV